MSVIGPDMKHDREEYTGLFTKTVEFKLLDM